MSIRCTEPGRVAWRRMSITGALWLSFLRLRDLL